MLSGQKPAREQGRIIALQPSTPLLTRGLLFSSIFFDSMTKYLIRAGKEKYRCI